jgi:diphosphomevalonate decarboxylase
MTTAIAHPNIAFIKYWGNRDDALRLPASGSLSMNLDGLFARTTVAFDPGLSADWFTLGGEEQHGAGLERVSALLDRVRAQAGMRQCAKVDSLNNFPTGAGIASSAAAFAALALAASAAAGLQLSEAQLSRLARRGSGSACRSIPAGFVEWQAGEDDQSSYAFSIAPADHWNLVDCVAVVSTGHKATGSTAGHVLAGSSPIQSARLSGAAQRLAQCRQALLSKDFAALAQVVEQDSTLMHAVMMTSQPPLFYWQPVTLALMAAVRGWRQAGLPCCYTIDAGPNVHVLCPAESAGEVGKLLEAFPGVKQVLQAHPGGAARLVEIR